MTWAAVRRRWPERTIARYGGGPWAVLGCAASVSTWPTRHDAQRVANVLDRMGCGNPNCAGQHQVHKIEANDA